jgi:hypothetical protein
VSAGVEILLEPVLLQLLKQIVASLAEEMLPRLVVLATGSVFTRLRQQL